MTWEVFSRDNDNRGPYNVVRLEDGIRYPEHIKGQRKIDYYYKSDAYAVKNKLNSEEDTSVPEARQERVINYDAMIISLYRSMLKLKLHEMLKDKDTDKFEKMMGSIDNISTIEGFEEMVDSIIEEDKKFL